MWPSPWPYGKETIDTVRGSFEVTQLRKIHFRKTLDFKFWSLSSLSSTAFKTGSKTQPCLNPEPSKSNSPLTHYQREVTDFSPHQHNLPPRGARGMSHPSDSVPGRNNESDEIKKHLVFCGNHVFGFQFCVPFFFSQFKQPYDSSLFPRVGLFTSIFSFHPYSGPTQ